MTTRAHHATKEGLLRHANRALARTILENALERRDLFACRTGVSGGVRTPAADRMTATACEALRMRVVRLTRGAAAREAEVEKSTENIHYVFINCIERALRVHDIRLVPERFSST